ncbi:PH domain-containing protein [Nocardiopsis halophila]|uniref:PH domain-containing protein n=1 Tax=Nocardiopsis halophila TaxID=141692 RepID=UPI000347C314|nr:PH domain-containing protein [Nocardiopsis halophila]
MEFAASDSEHREPRPGAAEDGRATEPEGTGGAPDAPGERSREAFAPPEGTAWTRVLPALDAYRRVVAAAVAVPCGVVGAVAAGLWLGPGAAAVPAAAALLALAAAWFTAGAARRSWGYAEGPTDLYLTHGTAVRQLVVVPYGRMQVVDVTADLLEQALGIATVRVRTAATTADTRIPGLGLDDAVLLRDRLAARSETFSTGL